MGCGGSSSDVAFRLSICLGTVDCFSLEFSRRFLFLRWSSLPRPSLLHAWSKFEPSSFCCSGSLRFLLFRSGVGGCWRLSVPARWLLRVSDLTHFLGSRRWSISSRLWSVFVLPEFSCGGALFSEDGGFGASVSGFRVSVPIRLFLPLGFVIEVGSGLGHLRFCWGWWAVDPSPILRLCKSVKIKPKKIPKKKL